MAAPSILSSILSSIRGLLAAALPPILLLAGAPGIGRGDPAAAGPTGNVTISSKIRSTRARSGEVVRMDMVGVINPITESYFRRALDAAEARGANLLLVEMDTPGGLVDSTRQIVKDILAARVPVAVYVTPQGSHAASAGVFITLAAHVAAMAPNTNIGSAHPVTIAPGSDGPEKSGRDVMMEKVTNDLVAWLKGITRDRGRNESWAEQAITTSANISSREALELNVIDVVAFDRLGLLERIHGRAVTMGDGTVETLETAGARIVEEPMTAREKVLHLVSDPNLAFLLLVAGGLGILFEITHPGTIVPGMAGVICLALAAMGLRLLPVSAIGLGLLMAALLMFVLELQIPSGGLLTAGGLTALAVGSYLLIEIPELRISMTLIAAVVSAVGLFVVVVLGQLVRSMRVTVVSGLEEMIGAEGRATETITGEGYVRVRGEYWRARLEGADRVEAGATVVVTAVTPTVLTVAPRPPAHHRSGSEPDSVPPRS